MKTPDFDIQGTSLALSLERIYGDCFGHSKQPTLVLPFWRWI